MHLQLLSLVLLIVTTTAYPLHRDTSSRETSVVHDDQSINQANEKANVPKDLIGMWKSHVESGDLYTKDSQNPMVEEVRRKLSLESVKLQVRLRQELAELWERLSPHPSHPLRNLANIRAVLVPFTEQLQSALNSNAEELCEHLGVLLPDLDSALHLEAAERISQRLDASHQKITASVEEFRRQISNAMDAGQDGHEKQLWAEVAAGLAEEMGTYSMEVQRRVVSLKASLAGLLTSAEHLTEKITAKVLPFCQSFAEQNKQFIASMEQYLIKLEEQQTHGELTALHQSNIDSIQVDFPTRLNALLQDIQHTMN